MELSDGQTLFIVLVVIYLSECIIWVRRHSVVFLAPWSKNFRVLTASFGNSVGGVLFVNPLPPLGSVFLSHLLPVSISPRGICAFNSQTLPGIGRPAYSERCLDFESITAAAVDGAHLIINELRFAKCASSLQARGLADVINRAVRTSSATERERLLRGFVSKQFSEPAARRVWEKSQTLLRDIKQLGSIFFIFLFVIGPVLIAGYGLLRMFIPVAFVTLTFAILLALMFHRARKELYDGETRWDQLTMVSLCPPAAIRVSDLLTRDLLATYNPIVLASLFAGKNTDRFVRAFILDLKHPLRYEIADANAGEIIKWAAAEQLRQSLAYIERNPNLRHKSLLTPFQPSDEFRSYCPRCELGFTLAAGECPDCPGVELLPVAAKIDVRRIAKEALDPK